MIQGTASHVGKSLLTAAFCRMFARRGWRVAPFKAQNMSNNAAVCGDGSEIGRAQAMQAAAAGIEPEAAMNPVLLKPGSDSTSQVVVLGRVDYDLSRLAWTARPGGLSGPICRSLDALLAEHDLVVCEGAGSPAETNLRDTDLANLRVAAHADAPALLFRLRPDTPVMVRTGQENFGYGDFYAYSKICTHVGCPASLYECWEATLARPSLISASCTGSRPTSSARSPSS